MSQSCSVPKMILCCDDEEVLCELVSEELEESGYTVLKAHSGKEALDILAHHHIDGVVSDIRMPNIDGFKLLKALKDKDIAKPCVVFVTGFAEVSEEDAYHEGVTAMLSKPINYDMLLESVRRSFLEPRGRFHNTKTPPTQAKTIQKVILDLHTAQQSGEMSLGRGGLYLKVDKPYSQETNVIFHIQLVDQGVHFNGFGRCLWTRDKPTDTLSTGMGIEIHHLDPPAIDFYEKWLQQYPTKAYIPKT